MGMRNSPLRYRPVREADCANFIVGARGNDPPAVFAGSRPQIDDSIGRVHDLRVVLHNQDGIAEVTQVMQDLDEPLGITIVQADGRFVETYSVPTSREPSEVAN